MFIAFLPKWILQRQRKTLSKSLHRPWLLLLFVIFLIENKLLDTYNSEDAASKLPPVEFDYHSHQHKHTFFIQDRTMEQALIQCLNASISPDTNAIKQAEV